MGHPNQGERGPVIGRRVPQSSDDGALEEGGALGFVVAQLGEELGGCLLYTSPSPRDS